MISVVIPSYKDPLLNKTVESLLANAEADIEVICVMDGYWQAPVDDKRVRVIHIGKNQGMRNAINTGVRLARGEYIMRTDEHCVFGKGFDRILTERFRDNWIVTPRRYFLDVDKWVVMDKPYVDYEKLIIDPTHNKFSGVNWKNRTKSRANKQVDETMAMQGSCWIMKKSWWDKIGELQTEGYGPQNQDSIEMVFKTWKLGGRLMVNKGTWFAHKHRDFPRTHKWQNQREIVREGYEYALNLWNDYYQEIRKKWNV